MDFPFFLLYILGIGIGVWCLWSVFSTEVRGWRISEKGPMMEPTDHLSWEEQERRRVRTLLSIPPSVDPSLIGPASMSAAMAQELQRRVRETENALREGLGLPPGLEVSREEAERLGNQPLRSWFGVLAPRDCGCCGRSPLLWARVTNRENAIALTCECGWWYTMQRLGVSDGRRMDIKSGHEEVVAGTCVKVRPSFPTPPARFLLSRPMRRFR